MKKVQKDPKKEKMPTGDKSTAKRSITPPPGSPNAKKDVDL